MVLNLAINIMSKNYKIKIFYAIAKDTRLSLREKLVAAFIYTLHYADKTCKASNEYISSQLVIPKRAVEKAIMNLEKHCLLEDLRDESTNNQINVCNNLICNRGYFNLSVDLLESDLDLSAIFIYSYVLSFNTSSKECFANNTTLGESLGIPESEIEKGLDDLRKLGWLVIIEKEDTNRELKTT